MRNRQIEGLRGFGILIIMVYHFFYKYLEIYDIEVAAWTCFIKDLGTFGNAIFFIITGFFLDKSIGGAKRTLF